MTYAHTIAGAIPALYADAGTVRVIEEILRTNRTGLDHLTRDELRSESLNALQALIADPDTAQTLYEADGQQTPTWLSHPTVGPRPDPMDAPPQHHPHRPDTDQQVLITITRSTGTDGAILIRIDDLPDHEELRVLCGEDIIGASIGHHQTPDDHEPRTAGTVQLRVPLTAIAYQSPPPLTAASLLAAYASEAAHIRAGDQETFIREAQAEPDVIVSEVLSGAPSDLPESIVAAVRDLTRAWITALTPEGLQCA